MQTKKKNGGESGKPTQVENKKERKENERKETTEVFVFFFPSTFPSVFRSKQGGGQRPLKACESFTNDVSLSRSASKRGAGGRGGSAGPPPLSKRRCFPPLFSFFIAHSSFRDEKKNSPLRKSVRFDFVCYCSDTLSLSVSPVSKKKHAFFVWASPPFPVKSLRDNKTERESTEKGGGGETERFFWVFLFPLVALLSFPNGRARPKKRTSERNGPSSEGMRAGRGPSRCPRRPSR